ncbi:MAG: Lrp/AsnC family transcriptional regulator [Halieaceae bacterium]|jgi:DNA-binding Lrp family transcriptional regulator|nr:Lrp/AsnC family transcriptional regulator [Halieaceae bacterium]
MQTDIIDQSLLALLRDDARASTSDLARRLGLSRSTVQSRLNKMLEKGIINGFTVQLGEHYSNSLIRAHVLLILDQKQVGRAQAGLKRISSVTALYAISGTHDMIAMVEAHSTAELNGLLDQIGDLEGIERTTSSVLLETKFER